MRVWGRKPGQVQSQPGLHNDPMSAKGIGPTFVFESLLHDMKFRQAGNSFELTIARLAGPKFKQDRYGKREILSDQRTLEQPGTHLEDLCGLLCTSGRAR